MENSQLTTTTKPTLTNTPTSDTTVDGSKGDKYFKISVSLINQIPEDLILYIALYCNKIGRYVLERFIGIPHLERYPNGRGGENWGSCPVCHLRWQFWDFAPIYTEFPGCSRSIPRSREVDRGNISDLLCSWECMEISILSGANLDEKVG